MATAFSETENNLIKEKLKACAREYLLRYGVRKTTVDQLAGEAAISKGSFYKFYSSKELLFWEVINDLHEETYILAENILKTRMDLTPVDRLTEALISCFNHMYTHVSPDFMAHEVEYLIRKLPPDVITSHTSSEALAIERLIQDSHFKFNQPLEVITNVIHALIFTTDHRESIGKDYETVMRIIIKGTFSQLIME